MIRKAELDEFKILTNLSIKSKSYWNYSKEILDIFKKELLITIDYIKTNIVWVYEKNNKITGFYSIKERLLDLNYLNFVIEKGYWLDHMFVLPEHIGCGIGTEMFSHLIGECLKNNIRKLRILADPHAKMFYEKNGCSYIKEYPSSIPGRTTPYLELLINKKSSVSI